MPFLSAFNDRSLNNVGVGASIVPLIPYSNLSWSSVARAAGNFNFRWAASSTYVIITAAQNNTLYRMDATGALTSVTLPTPTTADFPYGVAYGNGIFVAAGSAGKCVWTSPDGINWSVTNYSSAFGQSTYTAGYNNITYYNGTFVALISGGTSGSYSMGLSTSSNGTTWSSPVAGNMVISETAQWSGLTTDKAQTTFFSPSRNNQSYYWSTSTSSFTQYATSPWGPSNADFSTWIPDISSFAVVGVNQTTLAFLTIPELGGSVGSTVTLPTPGGGGLGTLSNPGKSSIVISVPWTIGATMQVSFNAGATWTNTTLPNTPTTGIIPINWNNKFYLVPSGNPDNFVCIGTPS